ncbi:hypothetical protein N9L48_06035 [Psychrosphaera sp.]|nr:hypothetical protein [Psychrosphaera sp.]
MLASLALIASINASANITTKSLVEVSLHANSNEHGWIKSWLDKGVGVHRYNDELEVTLDQALTEISIDFTNSFSAFATAQYTPDGDSKLGFNEAYINYQPLNQGLKHQVKVGYFYPQFSLENSDIGWTSPYTFNFSAINSWVGEEIKPLGFEWQIKRPGRQNKSNFSYTGVLSAYVQNDGLASLLAWRGWAIHNRQSVIGEKVNFADYFQFQPVENPNPSYVDINDETDRRVGFYIGAHIQYQRSTDIRLYYYDNKADPFSIETDMQYGWRTRFVSTAFLHKLTPQFRLLGQYMYGSTEMGDNQKGVHNDFSSWYLMAHYRLNTHRATIRFDGFNVTDNDFTSYDPNESDGNSVTVSYRYQASQSLQIGTEITMTQSENQNRTLWVGWQAKQKQTSYSITTQYRF